MTMLLTELSLSLENEHICLYHPLEACIKNIYTHEIIGAGLGWIVIASCPVHFPELYDKCRNDSVMARANPIIRKLTYTLTTSFGSIY
jgi:hypothetical protein